MPFNPSVYPCIHQFTHTSIPTTNCDFPSVSHHPIIRLSPPQPVCSSICLVIHTSFHSPIYLIIQQCIILPSAELGIGWDRKENSLGPYPLKPMANRAGQWKAGTNRRLQRLMASMRMKWSLKKEPEFRKSEEVTSRLWPGETRSMKRKLA